MNIFQRIVKKLMLLFNTTRAHTPDPQARGPLSLWTKSGVLGQNGNANPIFRRQRASR